MDAKLKHLEFIQAVIARMATNSFLFKGWAITIASALSAFAAVDTKKALLAIALISTAMFWGLDGYYLWLERCFVKIHETVAAMDEADIDFNMAPDKTDAFKRWIQTCLCRPHLWLFYGSIIGIEIVAIFVVKSK
jgi:hypothetical protein